MNKYIPYIVEFEEVNTSKIIESNCADILFTNKGSGIVRINSYPLDAGETIGFSANLGELCIKNFIVSFDAGALTDLLFVTRKLYTN